MSESSGQRSDSNTAVEPNVVRRVDWRPSMEEFRNWERVPCLKDSIMWGLAGGLVCGVGMAWLRNNPRYIGDGFFLGMVGTFTASFVICTHNASIRKQTLKKAFVLQSKTHNVDRARAEGRKAADEAERMTLESEMLASGLENVDSGQKSKLHRVKPESGIFFTDWRASQLKAPKHTMAMANAQQVLRQAAEQLVQGSLSDLVTKIRRNKGKDEHTFITGAIQGIRKELRSTSKDVKAIAVQKMSYLQMMGYDMSVCAPDVIEVMSFPRFVHKRIGYLAASVSFTSTTDILIMSTNLFRKDVTSSNQYEAGIALTSLACVVTPDLARDLAPDIVTLLSSSKPYVRKKAILVLYSIFCAFPDSLRPAFPKLKEKLKDEELPIVSAAVSVLLELARKNPNNYVKLAPTLFHLLTSGSAHSWLQLKLVKLFALLCPVEPRLPKRLVEPLTNIINTTPVMSLLYECINTCTTGLVKHLPIVRLCIQKLRVFIESPDQNHKYLGLLALGNIMSVHPKAVREHKDTVMRCLDDEDESIRLRALDLLVGMVDKKNLADVIERLLEHLTFKAEGHYKSQLISKIITIACQRDFKYIIDFEWYLGVLVRLAYVPGNEQGQLLSDQLMDVVVRVDVVRRFAVKEALMLLQDARFYASQSKIVEILYASAWIVGEFCERKEAATVVGALLDPVAKSVPGHIQAMFVSNALKVFSRLCGKQGGSGPDLLALSPQQGAQASAQPADEKLAAAVERCLALLDQNLPPFAESEVVEVQERALFAQQVLRIYRSVGNVTMATEIALLFAAPLGPVHPDAQSMVAVPVGLDLNAQINEWPEEESPDASWDDEADPSSMAAMEFGGYQQPGSASSGYTTAPPHKQQGPTGPVDKRYYLTGTISPVAQQLQQSPNTEPSPVPLDLGAGAPRVRTSQKAPKGSGKKAAPVKVVTALAMPTGAAAGSPAAPKPQAQKAAGPASALSSITLDDELTAEEKTLVTAKVYPNQTAPKQHTTQPVPVPIVAGSPTVSAPTKGSSKKEKGKKVKKDASSSSSVSSSAKLAPQPSIPSDASSPQVMCNTDKLSCICRVVSDPSNEKQVNAQIAIQNRSSNPLIHAVFELGPLPSGIKLVSRSLPNPFAVAANGVAPMMCVFQVPNSIHAPTQISGTVVTEQGASPIAFSFLLMPSLFVAPLKISLDDLGKRISSQAQQLKTASGVLVSTDQKAGLKRVAEKLRVKKIRIEAGAALFYGRTVHGVDVFVHIKRANESSMNVEIKSPDHALSQTLVNQAIAKD